MDLARFAIEKRVITIVFTLVLLGGGLLTYQNLSRLEDPEFTIKSAQVYTPYPGATAEEVEEEVADTLEKAIQQMGQLREIESQSTRGLSVIEVTIKDKYDKTKLPQVWDVLRRKVNDAQGDLPPGAGPSIVNDDFGDVYGVYFALYGPEYDYADLRDTVEMLQRELLLVQDVARVEVFASLEDVIYVEPQRERLAALGIQDDVIVRELRDRNTVAPAGKIRVGQEYLPVIPTGVVPSADQLGDILLRGALSRGQIYLRDVAKVQRGYVDPPSKLLRFDGHQAIGIGISTVSGGNVVTMGEALAKRLKELESEIPLGMELGVIAMQSDAVTAAISGFTNSLWQAVVIVIAVLGLFMGIRSALIIGFILVVTICGTFILMSPMNVALERISLGALIIALGMLVDNAIVVVDGMIVRIDEGQDPKAAASDVVNQTAVPLLGATFVAILAFAAIGTSQDNTGEYCRSLFQVVAASLGLSWVTAVTITPLMGVMFLRPSKRKEGASEGAYDSGFYRSYKALVSLCIRFRWLTIVVVSGLFALALVGFGQIDKSFFPDSTRPQLLFDYWMPQGTHIRDVQADVEVFEEWWLQQPEVKHVSTTLGGGSLRFLLTYTPEKPNTAFAQFVVEVEDYRIVDELIERAEAFAAERFPLAQGYGLRFALGPGKPGKVKARFMGPDAKVLRELAGEALAIMEADPDAKGQKLDWRSRVKVIQPTVSDERANLNGISLRDISNTIRGGFSGVPVGIYREQDDLIPIMFRAPEDQREDVRNLASLQIWSPAAGKRIPLRQVVPEIQTIPQDDIIYRQERRRTLSAQCDPELGVPASVVLNRVRPQIEAIPRPPGYRLEWWGEYRDSSRAITSLVKPLPIFFLLMVLTVVALFNAVRQPLIILLCVPLALIGVTGGLLATKQPFGFMAILGFLSLSGMLIKNAIVLIDQIDLEIREGKPPFDAILDSGASRLRPVAMAALTTALGMIPLLLDAFFVSMAVTVMAGLLFATLLTMFLVPVLYATLFRVPHAAERR
ncbi:MAG: efflux RND transporter permease subunit [Myxococcota bacterium]